MCVSLCLGFTKQLFSYIKSLMSYQNSLTETLLLFILLPNINKMNDIENKVNSTSQQMVIKALYKYNNAEM